MRNYILLACCIFNLSMLAQWNPEKMLNEPWEYEKYPECHPNYSKTLITEVPVIPNDLLTEIFPNPATGILTLFLDDMMPQTNVCVYNAFGKCVHDEVITKKNKLKIDLSGQPKGIYVMEIRSGDEKAVTKIMLQ